MITIYLKDYIWENHKNRVHHIEKQPYLNWLDVGGAGQGGGHREVHRGQHHHAGDVDRDDEVKLVVRLDVDHGLVHHIHQDSGQIGDHEDCPEVSSQDEW